MSSQSLSVTIDPEVPVSVKTTSLGNGNQGQPYSETLAAKGGDVPYTWAITKGTLPAGLSLTSYGVISGTPTGWGVSTFTVKATDLSSPAQTATGTVTLDVIEAPPTSAVVMPSVGSSVSGTQVLDASASSGVTQVQYELTGGSLTDSVIATATATVYGWLATWNTTAVPNGTYTLQSVASYAGGVSGPSPGITITVANTPPTSAVVVPSVGSSVSGTQVLDASASSGVTQCSATSRGAA